MEDFSQVKKYKRCTNLAGNRWGKMAFQASLTLKIFTVIAHEWRFEAADCPLVCKMKYGNRTWNEALSADLKHSGLLAVIAASDWHRTHQVVQWLLPSWSSWCKTTMLFCVTSSLLALQFAVFGACQQYISNFLSFWILFGCREEHFLEKRSSSRGWEGIGGLLYVASPWKQLSQGLRLVNYQTTAAPWWV